MNRKLFIVDPQNGFMDDGSLPVAGSHKRMKALGDYLDTLKLSAYDHITVSLDWHPMTHCSFSDQGGPWPQHCVAFTQDALVTSEVMTPLLRWMKAEKVDFITKGKELHTEEYSALDNPENRISISETQSDTDQLDVCGIVGTVCVQNTLQGLLDCKVITPEKVHVLPSFIAQFSEQAEQSFLTWCKDKGFQVE